MRHSYHHSSGGSSGGSYVTYGSSGGSSGGSYGGASVPAYVPMEGAVESYRIIDDRPADSDAPAADEGTPAEDAAPAEDPSALRLPVDAAMLVVELPESARVFVNGAKTSATGGLRRYVSRGLEAGRDYEFTVQMVDGDDVEVTRVVAVRAGEVTEVSFLEAADEAVADLAFPADELTTSLVLHVPADAKVWLAGNATVSSGETRVFETTTLRSGDAWSAYEVKVVALVDGVEVEATRQIDLAAGHSLELELTTAGDSLVVRGTAASDSTASL